jgi:hypothetical protein
LRDLPAFATLEDVADTMRRLRQGRCCCCGAWYPKDDEWWWPAEGVQMCTLWCADHDGTVIVELVFCGLERGL